MIIFLLLFGCCRLGWKWSNVAWNKDANWTMPDLTSFMAEDVAVDTLPLKMVVIAGAYALVMAVSLFGNLLVCYVVIRHRRLRSVTYTFLVNVALSDLLMTCLNIPFSVARVLLHHWPFGEFLCSLVNIPTFIK